MRRPGAHFALCFAGLLALLSCQSTTDKSDLTIACAASVQYAMRDLVASFEEANAISCEVIVGSSGKLTSQIINGAPYDLLVSADVTYPQKLFDEGLATDSPKVYSHGQIVLWTSDPESVLSLDLLPQTATTKIAIANPRLAPYGAASLQVLDLLGIYDTLKSQLVFGESVAQVNQFITTGVAAVGFTSLSTVMAPGLDTIGSWLLIPDTLHPELPQAALALSNGDRVALAQQFVDFLLSTPGQAILERHGYATSSDE